MDIEPLKTKVSLKTRLSTEGVYGQWIQAIALTLKERGLLVKIISPETWEIPEVKYESKKVEHDLELGNKKWSQFEAEHFSELYLLSGGRLIKEKEGLQAWLKVLTQGSNSFMDIHLECPNPDALASLIERGGDLFLRQ